MNLGRHMGREVVAIEADVQLAQGNLDPLDLLDFVNEHLREKIASRDDAHERDVVRALVGLEDLVRHARHRSLDVVCIHADRLDHALVVHTHSLRKVSAYRRVREAPRPSFPRASCRLAGKRKSPSGD